MNIIIDILNNFRDPAILFFILGMIAAVLKSDLFIPIPIAQFLSLYLLLCIGMRGGAELYAVGFNLNVIIILTVCILISFIVPFVVYQTLRKKLNIYDTAVIAASYGSVSMVTFITAGAFLESRNINFDSFMVAGLALMDPPAIIAGFMIFGLNNYFQNHKKPKHKKPKEEFKVGSAIYEALTNGSVLVLLGSLVIGYISGY